jgi:hypothetical protein
MEGQVMHVKSGIVSSVKGVVVLDIFVVVVRTNIDYDLFGSKHFNFV